MTKIDWTKWSAIAEVCGAVAIVATLIYLAVQTQYLAEQTEQNNRFLGAQVVLAQAGYRNTFDERVIQNADFAELAVRAMNNEELSAADQLRVRRFIHSAFSNLEMEYQLLQYTDTTERAPLLANLEALFENGYGLMRSEGVRDAWEELKFLRSEDFVRYVESTVLVDVE